MRLINLLLKSPTNKKRRAGEIIVHLSVYILDSIWFIVLIFGFIISFAWKCHPKYKNEKIDKYERTYQLSLRPQVLLKDIKKDIERFKQGSIFLKLMIIWFMVLISLGILIEIYKRFI